MNSKIKIIIGVLAAGIVFFSGLFILEQSITKPIEKPINGGEIVDGLQLTIEPVNAAMEEYGVYIFRNGIFQIKVTLENKGDRDLNLIMPMTTSYKKALYFQFRGMKGNSIIAEDKLSKISGIIPPDKMTLKKDENGTFYTYVYTDNFTTTEFIEGHYKLRYVYDTTDYKRRSGFEDVPELIVYSNDIMIKVIEDSDLCSPKNPENCNSACNTDDDCVYQCGCGCLNKNEYCGGQLKLTCVETKCECKSNQCEEIII